MKMVVYSRQKTEKQQQGIGWSTHLSRSRQNLVKNRFLEALQCKFEQKSHMGHHQEYEKCDSPCVDSWAFNCFRDLTVARGFV
ncbi:uncharacterized protein [Populus alba]|uniref:uncharacterized protein isoform X12 n=1 Tax=Populus alba TaxID=43335 RepID=UPI003CC79973